MPRKKSLAEVKKSFVEKWGDRYVYDLITEENYVNMSTKVPVLCKEHGLFEVSPSLHLLGIGCKRCGEKRWKSFMEVAINDSNDYVSGKNFPKPKSYKIWMGLLRRCYNETVQKKYPYYIGCSVCEEWLHYSNFKKWFEDPKNGYRDGYHLDKDIIEEGNRVYSPDTCCFVPNEINNLFKRRKERSLPLGVSPHGNRFIAKSQIGKRFKYLGIHDTIEEAEKLVNQDRYFYIKDIATKYYKEKKITERVYNFIVKRANMILVKSCEKHSLWHDGGEKPQSGRVLFESTDGGLRFANYNRESDRFDSDDECYYTGKWENCRVKRWMYEQEILSL